jgi:hypothetical protein
MCTDVGTSAGADARSREGKPWEKMKTKQKEDKISETFDLLTFASLFPRDLLIAWSSPSPLKQIEEEPSYLASELR